MNMNAYRSDTKSQTIGIALWGLLAFIIWPGVVAEAGAYETQEFWYVAADDDSDFCTASVEIIGGGRFVLMARDAEVSFGLAGHPRIRRGKRATIETDLDSFYFEPTFEGSHLMFLGDWMTTEAVSTLRLSRSLKISVDDVPITELAIGNTGFGDAMDAMLECSRGRAGWWGAGLVSSSAATLDDEGQAGAETAAISGGTGFFVTPDGFALTNAHVVNDCSTVQSQRWGRLTVVAEDQWADLAIVRPERASGEALRVRERGPRLGESVLVAGFPLTRFLGSGLKLTSGVVSGLSGLEGDRTMFQLTAPIQPGNSGGPVTDKDGALIGVVSSKLDDAVTWEESGSLPQNVNFAISGPVLQSFLDENGVAYRSGAETQGGAANLTAVTFRIECLG